MTDPVRELKTRAELLHRRIRRGDPRGLCRMRILPGYRGLTDEALAAAGSRLLRRQALAILARECGFAGWPHARTVLGGTQPVSDYGTLLCPPRCGGHVNHWYRNHEEALAGFEATGGYLLAFRRQFLVVDHWFIETLGINPADPDWFHLGFDWARPRDVPARTRLYGVLVSGLPRETT